MKKITLEGGPYNGKTIEDSGACVIRMALTKKIGGKLRNIGDANYIPNEDRELAFWDGNEWLGELVQTIQA